jgi:hypothetical protein
MYNPLEKGAIDNKIIRSSGLKRMFYFIEQTAEPFRLKSFFIFISLPDDLTAGDPTETVVGSRCSAGCNLFTAGWFMRSLVIEHEMDLQTGIDRLINPI